MNQCREYMGARDGDGYGRPTINGKTVTLTRWIVEQIEGPLLPGEIVRHACDNPPCFLYAHLRRGTHLENAQDRDSRGRNHNASRLACSRGHRYTSETTRIDSRGWRVCRVCRPHNR